MVKVFAKGSTGKEKVLGILFLMICFVGMGLGATICYYIQLMIWGSYENIPRLLFKIVLFVSMFASIPFISVPLFLLGLRPFYTRELVSQFLVSGRNPNLPEGPLTYMNFVYKVGFFWINFFYPADKKES